jgi:ABC-type proline/glycine betaine transport system substrate-binding protein
MIAGKHVDPDKAAEAWVKANPAKAKAWLGQSRYVSNVLRSASRHPA